MVTCIKDHEDRIIAYIEWWRVCKSGYHDQYGDYVWVQDLWVHPEIRDKGFIKELLSGVMTSAPSAKYMYWKREKYSGRKSRLYNREQGEKLLKKLEVHHGRRKASSTITPAPCTQHV